MKKLESLGRILSKNEQKKIMGGNKEIDGGGDYCCDQTSDCPSREGWSNACSTHYTCSSGRQKCFWTRVI